jgi:hypothetical protein
MAIPLVQQSINTSTSINTVLLPAGNYLLDMISIQVSFLGVGSGGTAFLTLLTGASNIITFEYAATTVALENFVPAIMPSCNLLLPRGNNVNINTTLAAVASVQYNIAIFGSILS